ncbi:MAG: glycosyltransferase family 1 protein [Pseudomonadota bacterium]
MRPILLNGKFLSAHPTGVHRVAEETIRALDQRLSAMEDAPYAHLLCPRDATRTIPLAHVQKRTIGKATWQIWEQSDLPRFAGPGMMINLCNLGPVARRDAVTMIHDAQVHDSPHSYSPAFRTYYRTVLPIIARRHRSVLTVSAHSRAALVRHGIAEESKITVIHNGVDHVMRTAPDRSAARARGLAPLRYVVALANAQAHKNIAMLIDAFRDPRLHDVVLVLVGRDPVAKIAPDAPPNVMSTGHLGEAALYGLMQNALAFACPSLTEGFGLPPLEAMLLGTPVIAAPCGALPEVLGTAALWSSPHRPAEWVNVICALAGSSGPSAAFRAERGALGRRHAAAFTWDRAAGQLLDHLTALEPEFSSCAA